MDQALNDDSANIFCKWCIFSLGNHGVSRWNTEILCQVAVAETVEPEAPEEPEEAAEEAHVFPHFFNRFWFPSSKVSVYFCG